MSCAIGAYARFSSPSLMGCMALRTLPNRLSADPVKPAVHLIRNSLAFANWKERKRLWKILSKAVRLAHSRSLAKCASLTALLKIFQSLLRSFQLAKASELRIKWTVGLTGS